MTSAAAALEDALRLHEAGRLAEAEALYRKILRAKPRHAEALHLLGIAAHQQGRHEEAVRLIRKALAVEAKDARFHSNLGIAYRALGRLDDATACYRRALALEPGDPIACNNLGNVLYDREAWAEAAEWLRRALALDPGYADAHHNLGNVLLELGRPAEAADSYRRALRQRGDYAEAHFGLASALLRQGAFAAGWPEYEWRWRMRAFRWPWRPFPQPQWRGEPLDGARILLHAEQGFGDTLQFIRYAKQVRARGGRIILEVQRPLHRLLATLPEVEEVVVVTRQEALPDFAWHAPLMSLPYACGTELATIPADVPYLAAEPAAVARWRTRLGGAARRKIGLVWSGSSSARKWLSLAALGPLAAVPDVAFFSLQKGDAAAEVAQPPPGLAVTDLGADLGDFADTAAAIMALDLVITIDTAVAHLAGALGRPVWILLAHIADWRWLLDRDDSPWYPTARLFRQPRAGDWASVVAAVTAALAHDRPG